MKWSNKWGQDTTQEATSQQDPLAKFKQHSDNLDVQPDMAPEQVGEIWAEKLMQVIRQQMDLSGNANAQYSL